MVMDWNDIRYVVEVSGGIEYYFVSHGCYAIPNVFASDILGVDDSVIGLLGDGVHYNRVVGSNCDTFTKMLFGIRDEGEFNEIIKEIEKESLFLTDNRYDGYRRAIYIIENIYRKHEEDGFNELIPSWYKALVDSLKVLNNAPNKNQTINDYIQYGNYLLDDMQLLQLHKMTLKNRENDTQ